MKLLRSRFVRVLVLLVFVGFQAGQMLHTHKASASDRPCAVCHVVNHTPGLENPSASALATVFTCQSLLPIGGRIVIADLSSSSSLPRAPPAV